jgi:hypothetical protein
VIGVVSKLEALAHRLAEARQFIARHRPDAVAREHAELELAMVGATPVAIREHKRSMQSLEARGRLAGELERRITTLTSRLESGGQEVEALHPRIAGSLGDEALLYELNAYQMSAEAALLSFQEVWTEVESP